jgi:lysophospholipase L1-like esterase
MKGMRYLFTWTIILCCCTTSIAQDYLQDVKTALQKTWPQNKTVNLVFHGHSVPSGYFRTPDVQTLSAYPQLVLKALKEKYPHAVVNVIVTAIGGENSVQGAARFRKTVLNHQPDVLFIDYALNDRKLGLERSKAAWEKMIRQALKRKIKVVLLTPSPDINVAWDAPESELALFAAQIRALAEKYHTGIVDSYAIFSKQDNVKALMAQSNHPNEKGHQLIADGIMQCFF